MFLLRSILTPNSLKLLRALAFVVICVFLLLGCQAQPRPSILGESTRDVVGDLPSWPAQARRFMVDRAASDLD